MRWPLISRVEGRLISGVGPDHHRDPGQRCTIRCPGFSLLLSLALALTAVSSGCADKASKTSRKEDTPYTRKVSSSIREIVERMTRDGVGPESSDDEAMDLSQQYSTSIVKVDHEGRIHCYITLDTFERENMDSLRMLSVTIEREEPALLLVQAWVPFDRIRPLSECTFVSRVRPPDYLAPR